MSERAPYWKTPAKALLRIDQIEVARREPEDTSRRMHYYPERLRRVAMIAKARRCAHRLEAALGLEKGHINLTGKVFVVNRHQPETRGHARTAR
jgi:hypothetical protein